MYRMQIMGDGQAALENKRFIDRLGNFETSIGDSDVLYLAQLSNQLNWDTLQPEYLTGYTDLPSTIIRLSTKPGDTSEVRFEYGAAPMQLEHIAQRVDSLRTALDWTPVNQDI